MSLHATREGFIETVTGLGFGGALVTFGDLWVNLLDPVIHGLVLVLTLVTASISAWFWVRAALAHWREGRRPNLGLALALALGLGAFGPAWSAATLLPNAEQQFVDSNGQPLAAGSACFYIPSTLTPKQTWQNSGETTPNTSPCVTLDSAGRALLYGSGVYRQIVKDQYGNTIWDQLTQDTSGQLPAPVPYAFSVTLPIQSAFGGL